MENLIEIENQSLDNKPTRPQFLTVLCVLSFIWSGIMLLLLFLTLCFSNLIFDTIAGIVNGTVEMSTSSSVQVDGLNKLLEMGKGNFVAIIAAVIIIQMTCLLGVVKMWKLQKLGFFIYAIISGLGFV